MDSKKLHDEWCPSDDCPGGCGFAKDIAAALAQAERNALERAALAAEEFITAPADYRDWSPLSAADDRSRKVAAAIRALSDET